MRIFFLTLLLSSFCRAQTYTKEHVGGSIGIVLSMGSHINAIGLRTNLYYTDLFFQINASNTFTLYHRSYGKRRRFRENRLALGLLLLGGTRTTPIDLFLDESNHQTTYNFGAGYSYIWYTDNIGTRQRSGAFALHIKSFSMVHENDLFGGLGKDRFRTAHLRIAYRHGRTRFGLGMNLWTGETANSHWERIALDKCPNGFRILENLPFGKTSHGIAYVFAQYALPFRQTLQLRLGADSEGIRHVLQNRLIHDLPFLPKRIERRTPHYPRLDEDGCAVFSNSDARKNRIFFQFGANENASY